jgi:hypothetical protein
VHIIKLTKDCPEWRDFLNKNEHLIIHTPEWKQFIGATFPRTKSTYYAIEIKGDIKFIFPIFNTKLSFLPNTSSAFLEYGGPAGNVTKKQFEQIKNKLPKDIEIRHGLCNNFLSKNFIEINAFKRFVLPLKTEEEIWSHIHKFKRKAVRLAEKSGIIIKQVPKKDINNLYLLYLKSMKSFGSAPYSKKYFENFYKYFVDNNLGKILGAYYKNKLVAILTGFTISNRIHININISNPKYLKFRPNDALHWYLIKWGCNNKYNEFDFGMVREESGQFSFKKKWNAELQDLNHFYFTNPKTNLDISNPFFKIPILIWKFMPLSLSALIGPHLRESVRI